mmetsp:Transcript_22719/g.19974  ORF Transcript_22719/g.19974 Transcript_22719/m.19974 type:complete len:166 (-) Transcript_22719:109-606(-)
MFTCKNGDKCKSTSKSGNSSFTGNTQTNTVSRCHNRSSTITNNHTNRSLLSRRGAQDDMNRSCRSGRNVRQRQSSHSNSATNAIPVALPPVPPLLPVMPYRRTQPVVAGYIPFMLTNGNAHLFGLRPCNYTNATLFNVPHTFNPNARFVGQDPTTNIGFTILDIN